MTTYFDFDHGNLRVRVDDDGRVFWSPHRAPYSRVVIAEKLRAEVARLESKVDVMRSALAKLEEKP